MLRTKIKCEKCEKYISKSNYKKHNNTCKNNKIKFSSFSPLNFKLLDNLYECPFCKKLFKKFGIGSHVWRYHSEEGKGFDPNKGYSKGERTTWNKGLNKETDDRLKQSSNTYLQRIKNGSIIPSFKGKKHTEETKKILSMKANKTPVKGVGKGKKGWFKGFWCDSSWELAWVIYNLDNGIKFKRNTRGYDYIWKNEIHKFFPDFILEDGTFIEIKGYYDERSQIKIKTFTGGKIKILTGKDITNIVDFIRSKYGKDFIKLYEK